MNNTIERLKKKYYLQSMSKFIKLILDIKYDTHEIDMNKIRQEIDISKCVIDENKIIFEQQIKNNLYIDKIIGFRYFIYCLNQLNIVTMKNDIYRLFANSKMIPINMKYEINNINCICTAINKNYIFDIINNNIYHTKDIINEKNKYNEYINEIKKYINDCNIYFEKQRDKHQISYIFKNKLQPADFKDELKNVQYKNEKYISHIFDLSVILNDIHNINQKNEEPQYKQRYIDFINKILEDIQNTCMFHLITYDWKDNNENTKIPIFIEKKITNVIVYYFASSYSIGTVYDKENNILYTTNCLRLEFNIDKKKFHMYPVHEIKSKNKIIRIQRIKTEIVDQIKKYSEIYQYGKYKSYAYIPKNISYIEYLILLSNNCYNNEIMYDNGNEKIKGLKNY